MNEFRRRRIRSGVITVCILAAIGAAIWIVVNPFVTGLGGTHKDWFVHVTAENLVEYSQHFVVARYADEAVYEIPAHSREYGVVQSHTDVYRRFEVVESLKGDFEPGDSIYVGWSAGYTEVERETGRRQFTPRVVAPLARGEVYGLFLNLRHSRSRHPDHPGTRIWETPDGLEVALVDDRGRFSFLTDQFYRDALRDMNLKPLAVTVQSWGFELAKLGLQMAGVGGCDYVMYLECPPKLTSPLSTETRCWASSLSSGTCSSGSRRSSRAWRSGSPSWRGGRNPAGTARCPD